MSDQDEIIHDPLTLALTKPVIKWGVPLEFFMINMMICVIVFLATEYLTSYLLAIPIHFFGLLVSQKDHHIFKIYMTSLQKTTYVFRDNKFQIPKYLIKQLKLNKLVKSELKEFNDMAQNRELPEFLPYVRFANDEGTIVKLDTGAYMAVLKFDGLFFQTKDISELNVAHLNFQTLIRSLGSSEYAITTTIIRRRVEPELVDNFQSGFAKKLNQRYSENLKDRQLFTNDIYLTILKRPMQGKIGGVQSIFTTINDKLNAIFTKDHLSIDKQIEIEACKELLDKAHMFKENLKSYGATILGNYVSTNDFGGKSKCNEILEMLVQLGNGAIKLPVSLPNAPLSETIATKEIKFGQKFLEFIGATKAQSKYAAIVSIREYSTFTSPGCLNQLLRIPHEFILSQSFSIKDRQEMQSSIEQRQRQIGSSDAQDSSLEYDIADAKDDLVSSKSIFGQHHTTVMCLGSDTKEVSKNIAKTTAILNEASLQTIVETTALRLGFFASFPGNFAYIGRPSFISSKNLCGFSPLHNFPTGQVMPPKIQGIFK